jgi:hypothetical protein
MRRKQDGLISVRLVDHHYKPICTARLSGVPHKGDFIVVRDKVRLVSNVWHFIGQDVRVEISPPLVGGAKPPKGMREKD